MKAVVDEDLPRSFTPVLADLGFAVLDVRDHGLRGHPDDDIFRFAQEQKAVLFSADLDFSNTLRFLLGKHSGIVVLRFPNEMSVKGINTQAGSILTRLLPEDYAGNLVILSPGKLRVRRYQK